MGTGEEPQVLKEAGGQRALWYASRPQNLTPRTQGNYRKGSTQRGGESKRNTMESAKPMSKPSFNNWIFRLIVHKTF